MEQLENRMIADYYYDEEYIENDEYQNYLEHLYEKDDERYEDEIFEKIIEEEY